MGWRLVAFITPKRRVTRVVLTLSASLASILLLQIANVAGDSVLGIFATTAPGVDVTFSQCHISDGVLTANIVLTNPTKESVVLARDAFHVFLRTSRHISPEIGTIIRNGCTPDMPLCVVAPNETRAFVALSAKQDWLNGESDATACWVSAHDSNGQFLANNVGAFQQHP